MADSKKTMAPMAAIKQFFDMSITEAKAEIVPLSKDDRAEIASLCAEALGVELKAVDSK